MPLEYLSEVKELVRTKISLAIENKNLIEESMRYSALSNSKMIRAGLIFASSELNEHLSRNSTLTLASSVELMHTYSLIHDDLPAMDDDDLRRGEPACHIQFDEATAILTGDALQAMAFEQLAAMKEIPPATQLELVRLLANHSGCSGMVAGQAIDLAATGESLTLDQLKFMHAHKTGALIEASVLMGAVATNQATSRQLDALTKFASAIGLAFQIQDDILDVESSTAQLGKQQGSDAAKGKPTYTSLLGLDDARVQVAELYRESIACLEIFGDRAEPLRYIAGFIVNRAY